MSENIPKQNDKRTPKPPGSRVRLKEVASLARVSVATVSMALSDHAEISDDTKRRVRRFCDQLGYRPRGNAAPAATSKSSRLWKRLGFLEVGMGLDDASCQTLLQELSRECSTHGIALQLASVETVEQIESASRQGLRLARDVDALLISGTIDAELVDSLRKQGVPYVVLGHTMLSPEQANKAIVHTVASDEYAMGQTATAALLRAGHKRIGFVSEIFLSGLSHWRWRAGQLATMADAGLVSDPRWFHAAGGVTAGGTGGGVKLVKTEGHPAADHFAALDPALAPTAYVIPDARIGTVFCSAMRNLGRELPVNAFVIAVDELQTQKFGVSAWMAIEYDHRAYVQLGLQQLRHLTAHGSTASTTTWVPYKTRNLPGAGI